MDAFRYTVFATHDTNVLAEPAELSCNNEIAAKLHAAAFTADGYSAKIYDGLAKEFVNLSTTKQEKVH